MHTFQVGTTAYSLTQGDLEWYAGKLKKYSECTLDDIKRKITKNPDQFAYRVTCLLFTLIYCELGQAEKIDPQRRKFVQLLTHAGLFSESQIGLPIWNRLYSCVLAALTTNNETFAVELGEACLPCSVSDAQIAVKQNQKQFISVYLRSQIKTMPLYSVRELLTESLKSPTNEIALMLLEFFPKQKLLEAFTKRDVFEHYRQPMQHQIIIQRVFGNDVEQQLQVIRALVDAGIDIKEKDTCGRGVLFFASHCSDEELSEMGIYNKTERSQNRSKDPALLKALLEFDFSESEKAQALFAVCEYDLPDMARLLLRSLGTLSDTVVLGCLQRVAQNGAVNTAKLILEQNSFSQAVNESVILPALPPKASHYGIGTRMKSFEDVLLLLLDTDAGIAAVRSAPRSLLRMIVECTFERALQRLLEIYPSYPHLNPTQDFILQPWGDLGRGETPPLHIAIANKSENIVKLLLQAGAQVSTSQYISDYHLLANHTILKMVVEALMKGEEKMEEKIRFLSSLVEVAWRQYTQRHHYRETPEALLLANIRYLLDKGATEMHLRAETVKEMSEFGKTALHEAALAGDLERCKEVLKEHPEFLEARCGLLQPKTATMLAQEKGHFHVVAHLLKDTFTKELLIRDEQGTERRVKFNPELLTKSPSFFSGLFAYSFKESSQETITIIDDDPEILEMIVDFLQTGALVIHRKNFVRLALVSTRRCVGVVQERLRSWLVQNPDCASWVKYLSGS